MGLDVTQGVHRLSCKHSSGAPRRFGLRFNFFDVLSSWQITSWERMLLITEHVYNYSYVQSVNAGGR